MSASSPTVPREQASPGLQDHTPEPQGVIRRNLKLQVYLGIAVLFIVATAVSSLRHKPAAKQQGQPPTPMVQDSATNIEEMRKSLEMQQRQTAAPRLEGVPAAVPAAAGAQPYPPDVPGAYSCVPGQPCPPAQAGYPQYQQQLSPQQQEQMQIETQERALAYKSRFSSNLAYSQSHSITGPSSLIAPGQASAEPSSRALGASGAPAPYAAALYGAQGSGPQASSLTQSQQAPQTNESSAQAAYKRPAEVNVNAAAGQPYVVYEGTLIETALMNRLDGDASGPVKVLVTNPVYSHDHQHVLIPDGTVVLGESRKIGSAGFGHQRRLAVVFHRMIMPDGYSVDLDQFQGLNQAGETGLKDKVNNHYVQIFGASIALGIIAGAAEVSSSGGVLNGNGLDNYKYGVAASLSQSATTVLDQFINIPPTITIREGHRVKVYISQDLLLPAYENHTIPDSF